MIEFPFLRVFYDNVSFDFVGPDLNYTEFGIIGIEVFNIQEKRLSIY